MSLADDLAGAPLPNEPANKGSIDVTNDGATVNNVVVESPINNDWSTVFKLFNLNADDFEVVDDTVRMSTWQQSRRTEGGDRDAVQLYSYSARFRRKPKQRLSDAEVEQRRDALRNWSFNGRNARVASTTSRPPVAGVINLADVQGGKSEGGGVAATQQRLLDGLANVKEWLSRQQETYDINEIVLVNNGDPLEGCDGSYTSQLFTVELNLRGQMNFVLDMWELYAKELFPHFEKAQFVSVLCNHGQLSRQNGRDNKTSDSDNVGGFLAETLRRVLQARSEFDHVSWTIPHDEMNVYTSVAGVPMAFNHGHKVPGRDATGFEKWLNGQVRGDTDAHGARIWQTAHRHHFACWDMGSCTVFQAPSLDGGSKWLRDRTGTYSRTGILTYLVGEHSPLGWSDLAFL
ncbi:hypothetical protein [Nocardia brasiliensis]|uniref:hypothetical protein n=1 Tax=Nocardia brasiliensis TaxID=37326 RepID=UPI0024570D26|nr:hypothetical protein [Nocardia brasiliensis]